MIRYDTKLKIRSVELSVVHWKRCCWDIACQKFSQA